MKGQDTHLRARRLKEAGGGSSTQLTGPYYGRSLEDILSLLLWPQTAFLSHSYCIGTVADHNLLYTDY